MTSTSGVVIGVLGRYTSDPGQPFPPRIETAGITLAPRVHAAVLDALQAAWESTDPWAPGISLQSKAETLIHMALRTAGISDVHVHVTVMEDIPYEIHH